jgi:pentatricopeptide repeat protein
VFDEMLQRVVKLDNAIFTTMINCARVSALSDKAVEWFEKMLGFGCEPDAITCSAMVCAYARKNHVYMARRFYDRAKTEK